MVDETYMHSANAAGGPANENKAVFGDGLTTVLHELHVFAYKEMF
jgi:hypothetical protein